MIYTEEISDYFGVASGNNEDKFDMVSNTYRVLGNVVGNAFKDGLKLEAKPKSWIVHKRNILHSNPDADKYPCYKVADSNGNLSKKFAFGGIEKQKEKLEKDWITVINYKVNLDEYKML